MQCCDMQSNISCYYEYLFVLYAQGSVKKSRKQKSASPASAIAINPTDILTVAVADGSQPHEVWSSVYLCECRLIRAVIHLSQKLYVPQVMAPVSVRGRKSKPSKDTSSPGSAIGVTPASEARSLRPRTRRDQPSPAYPFAMRFSNESVPALATLPEDCPLDATHLVLRSHEEPMLEDSVKPRRSARKMARVQTRSE